MSIEGADHKYRQRDGRFIRTSFHAPLLKASSMTKGL